LGIEWTKKENLNKKNRTKGERGAVISGGQKKKNNFIFSVVVLVVYLA
jgi:hypothetical protein